MSAFILRGAWAVGRMGKLLLADYKRALTTDAALFEFLDTVYSLVAIGRRSSGLRAEIAHALRAAPNAAESPGAEKLRTGMGNDLGLICKVATELMEQSDEDAEEFLVRFGAHHLSAAGDEEIPGDIRDELVRLLPVNLYVDGMSDGRRALMAMSLICATARGAPEQFYFPRALIEVQSEPWRPELTRHILEPVMKAEHVSRPVAPVRRGPGPNEPCSCGSGRKFKKCCGSPAKGPAGGASPGDLGGR